MHIEVPSSGYLMNKLMNFFYRITGNNYVTNLCPMHVPFHLYEFSYKSFSNLSEKLKYKIVKHEYFSGEILFGIRLLHPVLKTLMNWTNSGMQLTVWIKKINN